MARRGRSTSVREVTPRKPVVLYKAGRTRQGQGAARSHSGSLAGDYAVGKGVLRQAFAKAGVTAEVEVYAGTLHGWCPPDSAVYNAAHAERAWERLLALFKAALA